MSKASADARRRVIDAMIEAARPSKTSIETAVRRQLMSLALHPDPYAPIPTGTVDNWLVRHDAQLRAGLEILSDSMLEHERLRLSERKGAEIGTSLFGREQSDKLDARKARTEKKLRQLLRDHPSLEEDSAYRLLRLYPSRKGEAPRMGREEFHRLFLAVGSSRKKRDK
jgi:hypothetical protein